MIFKNSWTLMKEQETRNLSGYILRGGGAVRKTAYKLNV
jgi:hypothetical protein